MLSIMLPTAERVKVRGGGRTFLLTLVDDVAEDAAVDDETERHEDSLIARERVVDDRVD